MAGVVVRGEPGKAMVTRHPCTVGKRKAKAAGPGKVNAAATKKARVKSARSAAGRHKAHVKAVKAAAKTAGGRAVAVKAAGKKSGRTSVAAKKPC